MKTGRNTFPFRWLIFMRDERLSKQLIWMRLKDWQPREEVGFGWEFIEKSLEYHKLLVLIFVDCQKALDTFSQNVILQTIVEHRIDHRNIALIKHIMCKTGACVKLHQNTEYFSIKREDKVTIYHLNCLQCCWRIKPT